MGVKLATNMADTEARKAELQKLFDRIDNLVQGDKFLTKEELTKVFGVHAEEFLKFCDGQGGGEKDDQLTFDEFQNGIINDAKDLSEDEFKANWITRMTGVVEEAEKVKQEEDAAKASARAEEKNETVVEESKDGENKEAVVEESKEGENKEAVVEESKEGEN